MEGLSRWHLQPLTQLCHHLQQRCRRRRGRRHLEVSRNASHKQPVLRRHRHQRPQVICSSPSSSSPLVFGCCKRCQHIDTEQPVHPPCQLSTTHQNNRCRRQAPQSKSLTRDTGISADVHSSKTTVRAGNNTPVVPRKKYPVVPANVLGTCVRSALSCGSTSLHRACFDKQVRPLTDARCNGCC